jgi:hypothetical protein
VAGDALAADASENPFGNVPSEVNEQITDAVAALVGSRPDRGTGKGVNAVAQLDRIFLGEPIS